ncbi:diguanylate cyclase dgcp [Anaeramoeba flamelloides]|uniref:Diguanylate cyclase dgcp n=1 Tax=Anaeramoeba flamelloides TaxID=1746091 RepID=A0AAV7YYY3_9EUKA|nr:diguanylate cyclase dgcp [Anaeramoeba flamelloides]KAJ6252980.1 diguanylate cyclase dgcp [Anaeramoeba flamelloides]
MGNNSITNIKKSKQKQYYQTLNESTESIAILNQKAKYIFVNQNYCKLFGVPEKEMMHLTLVDLSPETQNQKKNSSRIIELITNSFKNSKTKKSHIFMFRHINRSGTIFNSRNQVDLIRISGQVCGRIESKLMKDPFSAILSKIEERESQKISQEQDIESKIQKKQPENIQKKKTKTKIKKGMANSGSDQNLRLKTMHLKKKNTIKKSSSMQALQKKIPNLFEMPTLKENGTLNELDYTLGQIRISIIKDKKSETQKRLINQLNQISEIFEKTIKIKNQEIHLLNDRLSEQKKKSRIKIQALEAHLQRRLCGIEIEKKRKTSLYHENKYLKKKLKNIQDLAQNQIQLNSQISSLSNFDYVAYKRENLSDSDSEDLDELK